MEPDQFIKSLREELMQTQNIRFRLSIQKLIFIIGLLGIGSLKASGSILGNLVYLVYFVPFVAFMFDIFIIGENFGIRRIGLYLKYHENVSDTERFWEFLLNMPLKKHRDLFAVHGNIFSTLVAISIATITILINLISGSDTGVPLIVVSVIWLILVSILCTIIWGYYPKIQNQRLLLFSISLNKYKVQDWSNIIKKEEELLNNAVVLDDLQETLNKLY